MMQVGLYRISSLAKGQPSEPLSRVYVHGASLEKAIPHGYYTHLVPKKIQGSDGVTRIYWVNPDPGKPQKLRLVHHAKGGETTAHHAEIKAARGIEEKDLVRYSEGDIVEITAGVGTKGKQGIYRGSLASDKNATPRVSIAIDDPKTGKMKSVTANVNNIRLVSRASNESKEKIGRSTVEVKTAKGTTTLVDKADYKKYYEGRAPKETPKEKLDKFVSAVQDGGVYERVSDGRRIVVTMQHPDSDGITYQNLGLPGKPRPKKIHIASRKSLEKRLKSGEFKRVSIPQTPKLAGNDKTRDIEAGGMLERGEIVFDANGQPQFRDKAAQQYAIEAIFENWDLIGVRTREELKRWPLVQGDDVQGVDFIEGLVKAVASYNPFQGALPGRLGATARAYARAKAWSANQKNMVTVAAESEADEGAREAAGGSGAGTVPLDRVTDEDSLTEYSTSPISVTDAIDLMEGLRDELDLLQWLYEDEGVVEALSRWTGLGRFEADYTRKEAAAAMEGLLANPKDGTRYAANTIETNFMPLFIRDLKEQIDTESSKYPEFKSTLIKDLRLRDKIHRKRQLADTGEKPYSTGALSAEAKHAAEADTVLAEEKAGRKALAGRLRAVGVKPEDVRKMTDVVEGIMTGHIAHTQYRKYIPREYVHAMDTLFRPLKVSHDVGEVMRLAGKKSAPAKLNRFKISEHWEMGKSVALETMALSGELDAALENL